MTLFIPGRVPVHMQGQVASLIREPEHFCRIHKVLDKDSKKPVPMIPMPMQDKIFRAVKAGHKRIAVIKARQTTATTGCKFVLHHMAYTTPHPAMHAVVSMRADSATMLLDDNRRWLEDPPELLQRPIRTKSRGEIVYADTGASLKAFTSRSSTGLRSFTPAGVVISEAAFAPDLEEVIAQADAAVGDGLLIIESTAKNPADFFSQLIRGAPENGWHLITMWWWEHPAYEDSDELIPEGFAGTLDATEKALRDELGLTPGQLHWRRRTALRLGSDHKFRREYPANLDDCFLDREGGYFGDELLGDIHVVEHTLHGTSKGREIEAPHPHDRYAMGVDIGGGVGGDYSALCVVSVATMQPVYTERNNQVTPAQWAHRCIQVATRYNNAMILAESNNHGHAFLLELNNCSYRNQWMSGKNKPWVTTLQSKLDAFDTLREALPVIKIMDRASWMELRALTILQGKIAPEAPKGQHDDSAIAMALAYRCLRDIPSIMRTSAVSSTRTRIDDLISASRARRIRSHSLPF